MHAMLTIATDDPGPSVSQSVMWRCVNTTERIEVLFVMET